MEDLKEITARNIAALRTARKMTQMELGERLRYSDKAISKWERGEGIPDAYVLKEMSEIFGVSVDYLLTAHGEKEKAPKRKGGGNRPVIALLVFFGVWMLATFLYVVLTYAAGIVEWRIFIYAVPVSLLLLLVFNSVWGKKRANLFLVAALVAALFLCLYIALLPARYWLIFVLLFPAEILVFLSFYVKKRN